MSIEYFIDKYLLQAKAYVNETFDFHIENTNNIDEIIKGIGKDFTNDDKLSELDDDLLYHHLTASKMLAQLAWNSYRNEMFYNNNNCEISEKSFYQTCHYLENKEFYKMQFENIRKGLKFTKRSIIEIISRYLIIFCILYRREVSVACIKWCIYCDNKEIGDICSICGGDVFQDVNCASIQVTTSNKNNTYNLLEKLNSNQKNENMNDNNENKLDTENSNTKPNFHHHTYILTSEGETSVIDQCNVEKNTNSDKIDLNEIYTHPTNENSLVLSYNNTLKISNSDHKNLSNTGNIENSNEISTIKKSKECNMINNGNTDKSYQKDIHFESEDTYNPKVIGLSSESIDVYSKNQWVCNQCSFRNNEDDILCVVCYSNKPDMIYQLPEETWNCRQCNTINTFNDYKCHECEANSYFFNKWVCEKCSFHNDKLALRCKICKSNNQHLVKCSKCFIYYNKKYEDKCDICKKYYVGFPISKSSNTHESDFLTKGMSELSIHDTDYNHPTSISSHTGVRDYLNKRFPELSKNNSDYINTNSSKTSFNVTSTYQSLKDQSTADYLIKLCNICQKSLKFCDCASHRNKSLNFENSLGSAKGISQLSIYDAGYISQHLISKPSDTDVSDFSNKRFPELSKNNSDYINTNSSKTSFNVTSTYQSLKDQSTADYLIKLCNICKKSLKFSDCAWREIKSVNFENRLCSTCRYKTPSYCTQSNFSKSSSNNVTSTNFNSHCNYCNYSSPCSKCRTRIIMKISEV